MAGPNDIAFRMSGYLQAKTVVTAYVDADDIAEALGNNDELILTFVCELIARSHSLDMRERLLDRLGVELGEVLGVGTERIPSGLRAAQYNPNVWDDEEYLK